MAKEQQLRVALICHFSNELIRKRLPLSNHSFYNIVRKIFRKKLQIYSDFAPWVTNLIKEFEKFEDIDVHIISPHQGLNCYQCSFKMNGINYYFYRPEFSSFLGKVILKLLRIEQDKFTLNRYIIKHFVKRVQPDIINLVGTENPYYSASILNIKSIPVYVSVQTVYCNPNRKHLSGECNMVKWNTEMKIHKKEKYFGCTGRMHMDLILKNNPDAIIFKNFFPIQLPVNVKEVSKEFDFIFFAAQISSKKGIEDALLALALVKKKIPSVTLNIVGGCTKEYKDSLIQKIIIYNLVENISFSGFFQTQAEMHQHLKKARFALLPVKLDIIPGTVIEAMLLGLPVVTYKTTGTPYLNKDGVTVLLSEIGDIAELSENMLGLMNSDVLAENLKRDARKFAEKEFDNTASARHLVKNYQAVLNHYYYKKPIPKELLLM